MLYRILHAIFGWDYIQWTNAADSGIARIRVDAQGKPFYWRYKIIYVADLLNDPFTRIIWLTCKPEKYSVERKRESKGDSICIGCFMRKRCSILKDFSHES